MVDRKGSRVKESHICGETEEAPVMIMKVGVVIGHRDVLLFVMGWVGGLVRCVQIFKKTFVTSSRKLLVPGPEDSTFNSVL